MQIKTFLGLVEKARRINFYVVCSDLLGLQLLLPKSLQTVVTPGDVHYLDASNVTKERARTLEKEARKAPAGSSRFNVFVIYSLQNLPPDSVGPLLKAVEEARYSIFIFQAQVIKRATRTLLSRSVLVNLPFFTKRSVLGNMQALNYDAKVADDLDLYDGTLSGTIRALGMKDTLLNIRRDLRLGQRGVPSIVTDDTVTSLAFDAAIGSLLNEEEVAFLGRGNSPDRKKLILTLVAERESSR
jgi:hypothetical protein